MSAERLAEKLHQAKGEVGRLLGAAGVLAASGSIDWRPEPVLASGFPEENPHTLVVKNPHGELIINGSSGEERVENQGYEEGKRAVGQLAKLIEEKNVQGLVDWIAKGSWGGTFSWSWIENGKWVGRQLPGDLELSDVAQFWERVFQNGQPRCLGFFFIGSDLEPAENRASVFFEDFSSRGLSGGRAEIPMGRPPGEEWGILGVDEISKERWETNPTIQDVILAPGVLNPCPSSPEPPPEGESRPAAEQAPAQGIEGEKEEKFRRAVLAYAEPVENQDSANVQILNIQFLWNVYGYNFDFRDHLFKDEGRALFDKAFARGKPECVSFKHLGTTDFTWEGMEFSLASFQILFRNLSALDRPDLSGYAIATTGAHPRDTGFTIIEELTQADFEALQGELATWTPCRPQEAATAPEQPRIDETPVRLLILIPGANTPTRTDVFPTGETGAFIDITSVARRFGYNAKQWPIYSRNVGVVNQYGEWEPNPASCEDTGRSLEEQKKALHQMLLALEEVYPNAQHILVGYSLGGVVAFEYAKDNPERVAGVIIFSAPVDGLDKDLVRDVLNRVPFRGEKPCIVTIVDSPAIGQLQEWAEDPTRPRRNREAALRMLEQGITLVVAGNEDCDAVIAGLRECLLGIESGNNDRQFLEIPWVDDKRRLGSDINSGDTGHSRILQDRGEGGAVTEAFRKVPQLGFVPRTPQNWGK